VAIAALASQFAGAGPSGPVDRGHWLRRALDEAVPGAVIEVPEGRYVGPFTINKTLTLRGRNAVLVGDGKTHVVAVRAPGVTIEGFEIRESGIDLLKDHAGVHVMSPRVTVRANRILDCLHGIYIRGGDGARVEDNTIVGRTEPAGDAEAVNPLEAGLKPGEGEVCAVPREQNLRGNGVHIWGSVGHAIERNLIRETRDGIYFSFVDDSTVRGNDIAQVRYGLHYMYSDSNRFEGNVFRDNAAGAALMYSKQLTLEGNRFVSNRSHRAYGLLLQSVDETTISANEIAGNTMGLFVENGHGNRVLDNRIAGNHVGIRISDSSDANAFAGNQFVGNIHPVETTGHNGSNRWSIDGRGNQWDGALRIDLDGNGVGDLPHRELDLFGELRRPFPVIGLLAASPGERLLRIVHGRLALPGAPGIVDPAPVLNRANRAPAGVSR
jgi:nitrous oxidase accessory protein